MVQGEDLLALFNSGFNRLPAVVPLEPTRQILRNRVRTEVKQGALLESFTGVEGPRVLTDPKTTIRIFANVLLALQAS